MHSIKLLAFKIIQYINSVFKNSFISQINFQYGKNLHIIHHRSVVPSGKTSAHISQSYAYGIYESNFFLFILRFSIFI